jgi:hypothetical protein
MAKVQIYNNLNSPLGVLAKWLFFQALCGHRCPLAGRTDPPALPPLALSPPPPPPSDPERSGLTGAHCAHVREVANEVCRAGDQLQAPMGQALSRQATEEVQLIEFPPVPQGQG